MSGKKKKAAKAAQDNQRPSLGHPTGSLRADIEATRNPFVDGTQDADDGDDIAAQLLASLDARDEAEAAVAAEANLDTKRTSLTSPLSRSSLSLRNKKSNSVSSSSSATSPSSRSGGGVLANLKEAGGKLMHPHSSRSPTSPPPTEARAGVDHGASGAKSPEPVSSNGNHHPILRGFYGAGRNDPSGNAGEGQGEPKKVNRQKARKQRKDAEAAAERARIEEELKANGGKPDEAALERQGMMVACDSLKVDMHEINPDGHCLYAAIADQINLYSKSKQIQDYKTLRRATAAFMREHPDDFAPFISDSDEHMAGIENTDAGNAGSKGRLRDHFMSYCDAIESTGVWGGQPEILALSRAFQTPIWVVQAGQAIVKVGDIEGKLDAPDRKDRPVLISYHRRMYGLGEHYNSLRPRTKG